MIDPVSILLGWTLGPHSGPYVFHIGGNKLRLVAAIHFNHFL